MQTQYKNKFTALFWRNLPYFGYAAFGIVFIALVLLDVFSVSQVALLGGNHIPYAIAALGINLLLGYAGLVSLGTAGFMGLGAYLTIFFMVDLNWSFIMALVASVTFCVIVGLLTGFIACRVSGWYLAIATLAIAEMLRNIFSKLKVITGGDEGKAGRLPFKYLFGNEEVPFTEKHMLILMIIVLTIIMIFTLRLFKSYYGRAMLTMNGSEPAAQTMGVNLTKYRLLAFAINTAYVGIAGVFYATASNTAFVTPTKWLLFLSLNLFAVVIIGGLCSISGTLIGTFIMYTLVDMWLKTLWQGIENFIYILSGVLIIVVSVFWPGGIIALFIKLKFAIIKWNYKRKAKKLYAKMQAAGMNPMGGGTSNEN
ncbi:MAG: branched-chain amino acid ABC transporter permease [Clostridia bacterium]|nr:branched-chain amino acid ABC transporter permease [Clostridia bacterium]